MVDPKDDERIREYLSYLNQQIAHHARELSSHHEASMNVREPQNLGRIQNILYYLGEVYKITSAQIRHEGTADGLREAKSKLLSLFPEFKN